VYPVGLSLLPAPKVWSFLFFATLVLVGIDTQVCCKSLKKLKCVPAFDFYRKVIKAKSLASRQSLLFGELLT